jgi:DNA-binding transcriptional LysR family regulator
MTRKIHSESQIGRRLKLRDLQVFLAVVQCGSMVRAAAQLGVSQPTVSEVIADLEHTFGVRLLDRRPQGVEPTMYGAALLKRSAAAFDELKQSSRDIEFLADPSVGDLRIGCPDSIAATILPLVIEHFRRQHPRVALQVDTVPAPAIRLPGLRDRKYDLVLAAYRFAKLAVASCDPDPEESDVEPSGRPLHRKCPRCREIDRRPTERTQAMRRATTISGVTACTKHRDLAMSP